MSNDKDWLFDYMIGVMQGADYDCQVMGFVDDNCCIFDNEEENKLSYMDCHKQFRELIETLLSAALTEVGISSEEFVDCIESSRFGNEVNKAVYEQIIAMDDFLTFKKLMVKRNMELELEAVRELQKAGIGLGGEGKEQEEKGAIESNELAEAMRADMMEMELMHKQEEMEQLELEQAIAMSLALEGEMVRAVAQEEKEQGGEPSSRSSQETKGHEEYEYEKQEEEVKVAPASEHKAQSPTHRQSGSEEKAAPSGRGSWKGVTLAPLSLGPGKRASGLGDAFSALPKLEELEKQRAARLEAADQVFKKNQQVLEEQRRAQQELQREAQCGAEEMEARARHLREARDQLVAKKRREREGAAAREAPVRPPQGAKASTKAAEKVEEESKKQGEEKQSVIEERRQIMRVALARRMKQELLESRGHRLSKFQAQQLQDAELRQAMDSKKVKEKQFGEHLNSMKASIS